MEIFDEDPNDQSALIAQLGGTPPPVPPEILAKMLKALQQSQTSRQVLDQVKPTPPMAVGPVQPPAPKAPAAAMRAATPEERLTDKLEDEGSPVDALMARMQFQSKETPPPGPTAMRGANLGERLSDLRGNVWDALQPAWMNAKQTRNETVPEPSFTRFDPMMGSAAPGEGGGLAARTAVQNAAAGAAEGVEGILGKILKPRKPAAVQLPHLERAPAESIEGSLLVSGRVPWAKNAPKETAPLGVGLDEVLKSDELVGKLAKKFRDDPILTASQQGMNDRGVLDAVLDTFQSNNEYLIKQMAPHAERSAKWYDGANKVAHNIAMENGFTPDQGSGVLAVLSPTKDWHQNAEMGQRIARNFRRFQTEDPAFSPQHASHYVNAAIEANEKSIAKKIREKGLSTRGANKLRAEAGKRIQGRAQSMTGRRWNEMNLDDQAIMMRSFDEVENGVDYPILTPEGGVSHQAMTKGSGKNPKPKPGRMSWQSYAFISKALSILHDGSPENISEQLGDEHKVRAFFNNISNPNYGRQAGERGPSTIDTHAIGGAHMRPFGTKSGPVKYSMGGVSDAGLGISGSNPLYQEAMARAAKSSNLLPRQAQSVSWEGIKGLFNPDQKRNKGFEKQILGLWQEYNQGRISLGSLQDAILNEAGGIDAPAWKK